MSSRFPNPDHLTGSAIELSGRFAARFGDTAIGQAADKHGNAREQRAFRYLVFGLFGVYIVLAIVIYVTRQITITPDAWAIFLLVAAVILGRIGPFLRDWIPFVLLIFGYELLRGVAGQLALDGRVTDMELTNRAEFPNVHLEDLMRFDLALFGGVEPINKLHGWAFDRGTVHWYDYAQLIAYAMHFVIPCMFAFGLWLFRRDRFWLFTLGFTFMTYSAFAFFLFYPAAPPWIADIWGYIALDDVQNQTLNKLGGSGLGKLDMATIWGAQSPHPMAAMPSLHAGFPWLMLLFAVRYFRWWGLLVIFYNAAIWFSIVYSANHWVVDVLAGMAWATVAFVLMDLLWYYVVNHRSSGTLADA